MKERILVLTAVFSLLLGLSLAAEKKAAAAQTIGGTLVDLKCYTGGGFKGNDHMGTPNCGTLCAKSGIPVALLDAKGGVSTILGPAPALAEYIGQEARVTGKVDGKSRTITPEKVEVKEGGTWKEVKLKTMM